MNALNDTLPLVVTDLDGTIVNLMDEVLAHIYDIANTPLTPEDCKVYQVHEAFAPFLCHGDRATFPDTAALCRFLVRTCWLNPAMLRRAKPYWNLWRTLLFYQFKGGKVVGLTSRNRLHYGLEDATRGWMGHWLPMAETRFSMDFVGESTPERKHKACLDLTYILGGNGYIFIDDEPEVADYCNKHAPDHCTVLMPDRPWTSRALVNIEVIDPAVYLQNVLADALMGKEEADA